MKTETYTDTELVPFFDEISKGFTVDEAVNNVDYCHKKMNSTMVDLDVRRYVLAISLNANHSK